MPDPARRPHKAKRIDPQEGDSRNDQREFQIAFSNLVVHQSSYRLCLAFRTRAICACGYAGVIASDLTFRAPRIPGSVVFPMSALGQKRISRSRARMSAKCQERTSRANK